MLSNINVFWTSIMKFLMFFVINILQTNDTILLDHQKKYPHLYIQKTQNRNINRKHYIP